MEIVAVKKITSTGVILATGGFFVSAVLAAGADAATLILYDDPDSANGTEIFKLSAVATGHAEWSPGAKIAVYNGIWGVLGGASSQATVAFKG